MKINYKPNPLETTVDLDEHDIEILRLKITIEDLEERIYDAHFSLEQKDYDEAIKELHVESLETDVMNSRIDRTFKWMTDALQDKHIGDCTCIPCSCLKCHTEHVLGINTIKGLGKHSAYKINDAFANGRSIDEAIAYLENYHPIRDGAWLNYPQEDFDKHVPRWMEEAKRAAEWLKNYKILLDQESQ